MNKSMVEPSPSDVSRNGWLRRIVLAVAILSWQAVTFAQYAPGACTPIPNSKTCVDATPCKISPTGEQVCLAGVPVGPTGFNVAKTCWQYAYQYACTDTVQITCTPYESNKACGVVASSCQNYQQPSGVCDSWQYTYKCETQPAQTTQELQCTNGLFDTSLMPAPANTNNTFVLAAIAQEMLRESQLYSMNGNNIFAGVKETCTKGYGGIKNCCKSAPGAKNNSQMASIGMSAAASVVKYYGQEVINAASQWMYDAMYTNEIWTAAMDAIFVTEYAYGQTALVTSAANGFSIGAYGFTYSSAAVGTGSSVAGGGLFGGDTVLLGFGSNGASGALMFNPYVFVIMVVIAIITSLMQCSQDEQMLAMHKGANLSVYEGEECTSKAFGACVLYTDTYCSFNSVLAKIVNTAGKQQLGLAATDCTGFSVAQLKTIDFTKIDFSEFAASVAQHATQALPSSSAMNEAYTPLVKGAAGGAAQAGTMIPGSSIIGGMPAQTTPPPNPNLPTYPSP